MTTLRDIQKTPLPDLSQPEWSHDPENSSPVRPEYKHNLNYTETRMLFEYALRWTASVLATADYFSDSTIDSHQCLSYCITDLVNVIYCYDQTMDLPEAINKWLDDEDVLVNLMTAVNANMPIPEHLTELPPLFHYFDVDNEDIEY